MHTMTMSADDREQLVAAFLAEADETIGRLEELLLQLEQSPDNELLHEIFRAAHTIKGNAACLQFEELTALAHAAEELLERLRHEEIQATPAVIGRLLDAVDAFRDLAERSVRGESTLTTAQQTLIDDLVAFTTADARPIAGPVENGGTIPAAPARAQKSLRVASVKLDRMLDLTGEIAIARGHVRQLVVGENEMDRERVLDSLYELDRLNLQLQELVMHARLVPLGPALRPFHRIVRDVAATQSKHVVLVIDGGDVEVDTAVVEHLKDPITHMIRNAIDHGIEAPDARVAAGKSPIGTIRIAAAQEHGAIVIRFSDDGAGIDEARIVAQAKTLGLDVERLTAQEVLSLIFEPGFTTAAAVSDLSGRGVGMDVVLRNIEALRGSVSIETHKGAGTTFVIRLPLTLAVIDGFGVTAADETYVVPMEQVLECVELPADHPHSETTGVMALRDELVPYVRLRQLFALPGTAPKRENVLVVQHDGGRVGLVVDGLHGGAQTVIKPLGTFFDEVTGIAGSSILGDGRVALILDPAAIVRGLATRSQS
jgi:two-component system, chemotaxis family, sensor kinase CheA